MFSVQFEMTVTKLRFYQPESCCSSLSIPFFKKTKTTLTADGYKLLKDYLDLKFLPLPEISGVTNSSGL